MELPDSAATNFRTHLSSRRGSSPCIPYRTADHRPTRMPPYRQARRGGGQATLVPRRQHHRANFYYSMKNKAHETQQDITVTTL